MKLLYRICFSQTKVDEIVTDVFLTYETVEVPIPSCATFGAVTCLDAAEQSCCAVPCEVLKESLPDTLYVVFTSVDTAPMSCPGMCDVIWTLTYDAIDDSYYCDVSSSGCACDIAELKICYRFDDDSTVLWLAVYADGERPTHFDFSNSTIWATDFDQSLPLNETLEILLPLSGLGVDCCWQWTSGAFVPGRHVFAHIYQ